MKCNMLLCDRAVGQVPRQGSVVGQWVETGVKTGECRKIAEDKGVVVKTRAVLGLWLDFMKCARRMHAWWHRFPWGPIGIGNMF